MCTVISFFNQKGGVAKTTSCFNVASLLAKRGKRVLMIDLDSQASLTIAVGQEPFSLEKTIADVVAKEDTDIREAIIPIAENLDLVASTLILAQVDMELIHRPLRETILLRALANIDDDYDYVLLDCPPNLSVITTNALSASDYVLIPVKTDYLAYRGLELVYNSIETIKKLANPDLEVLGVIATMFESRLNSDKEVLDILKEDLDVIATVRRLSVGKKMLDDNGKLADSRVTKEYEKVVEAILEKEEE